MSSVAVAAALVLAFAGVSRAATCAMVGPNSAQFIVASTLTNNQASPTPANFTQMVTRDPAISSSLYAPNLDNANWQDGAGNLLNSWLESGESNTSNKTIYWVNLGANVVPANGTLTIYQCIYATSVSAVDGTDTGAEPNYTGTYGQYDNGATVFPFYDNFAGTTLNAGLWNAEGNYTVNNGLSISDVVSGAGCGENDIYSSSATFSAPAIGEAYGNLNTPLSSGQTGCIMGGVGFSNGKLGSNPAMTNGWAQYIVNTYGLTVYDGGVAWYSLSDPPSSTENSIFGLGYIANTLTAAYINYQQSIYTSSLPTGTGPLNFVIGFQDNNFVANNHYVWARVRDYPPGGAMPSSVPSTAKVFTGNYNQTVTVFAPNSNGDAAPSAVVGTADTPHYLNYPFGLAYNTNGDLYVINYGGASIGIYPPPQYGATGDPAPLYMIGGPKTGLTGALGIAVNNSNGDVYVANSAGGPNFAGSITVYSAGATGNASPSQTIVGYPANTACLSQSVPFNCCTGAGTGTCTNGLYSPQGVAVDPNTGNIYVANLGGPIGTNGMGSITEYAANATGPATPIAEIVGPSTGLSQPSGIAIDANSNVYVANNDGGPSASGAVTIYTPAGIAGTAPSTEPDGGMGRNVAPDAMIAGPASGTNYTLLNEVEGIAVDANGVIYVSNFGKTGSVTIYSPLASLITDPNYPNVMPVAEITGPDTGLVAPRGIAVDPPPAQTRRARRRHRHRRGR
ncbi:MAG: hypothetical protein ACREQI_11405 [Candidatus Binataceae bacterium]